MPVAIAMMAQATTHSFDRRRQGPALERCAVAQRSGLLHQHRQVVPRIVNRLIPTKPAHMLGNKLPILADDDTVGIGVNLNRASGRLRMNRVLVVIEPDQQRLGDRGR